MLPSTNVISLRVVFTKHMWSDHGNVVTSTINEYVFYELLTLNISNMLPLFKIQLLEDVYDDAGRHCVFERNGTSIEIFWSFKQTYHLSRCQCV